MNTCTQIQEKRRRRRRRHSNCKSVLQHHVVPGSIVLGDKTIVVFWWNNNYNELLILQIISFEHNLTVVKGKKTGSSVVRLEFRHYSIKIHNTVEPPLMATSYNGQCPGGQSETCPSLNAAAIIAKNWRNRRFCWHWEIPLFIEEVERCPPKSAISAIFPKIAKTWRNRKICWN